MPDVFLHLPKTLTSRASQPHSSRTLTLLYFVPGNPGLIEYYTPFFTLLAKKSETWTEKGKAFGIAGASLGGFEASTATAISKSTPSPSQVASRSTETDSSVRDDGDDGEPEDLLPLYPPSFPRKQTGTYTLRDQIGLTYARITTLVERLRYRYGDRGTEVNTPVSSETETKSEIKVNIILAGHSVGAYIALEVLNLHHQQHQTPHISPSTSPSPFKPVYTITQTHLLTPTILNISHSPSGRIATPLLSYLPFLPFLLQLGASGLTGTLPRSWVRSLVARVTGMKSVEMVDVTVEFLGRGGAVRQALELAGWEMREIGVGRWEGAVWGSVDEEGGARAENDGGNRDGNDHGNGSVKVPWKPPVHHFLFAKEDHWVADETRETIVKSVDGRAKVLVDDGALGLVHAWCLEQSGMVARIVSGWIEEMLFGDE